MERLSRWPDGWLLSPGTAVGRNDTRRIRADRTRGEAALAAIEGSTHKSCPTQDSNVHLTTLRDRPGVAQRDLAGKNVEFTNPQRTAATMTCASTILVV